MNKASTNSASSTFDWTQLCGVIPPLVTPLLEGAELDRDGLECLLEHVLSAEMAGLFVLGTTGEGPALPPSTRRAVVEETLAIATGGVPVFVGVSDASLRDAIAAANHACDAGAAAVVATPPFYFPLSQTEVAEWFEAFASASPLPVMLYNFSALAKTKLAPETVTRLMQCENIIGVKDSDGDMDVFAVFCQLAKSRPDWRVFIGPEHLLSDAVSLGAHGGVAGGANVAPQLFVDFYQAAAAGDVERTRRLRAEVGAMHRSVYGAEINFRSVVTGIKRWLAEENICDALSVWDFPSTIQSEPRGPRSQQRVD